MEQTGGSNDEISGTDWTLILYPRIAGLITVISSLCMIAMASNRRKFTFHRLVLAMSIHQFIYGVSYIIGVAAIPREVGGYVGNLGTWGTCTAQGFLQYVSTRVSMLYYASFSIYSYIGVMRNFDRHKYEWCEKWIHLFTHSYPLIMGVYYLFTKGFSPGAGFCRRASYPHGCELSEEVVCERGPDNFGGTQILFHWLLPMIVFVVFPTAIMIVLYYKVKGIESNQEAEKACILRSQSIAIQSCAYLSAMYWTIFPFFISGGLQYYSAINLDKLFPYLTVSQINLTLFSFWSMLAYRYFSIDPYTRRSGRPTKISKKMTMTMTMTMTKTDRLWRKSDMETGSLSLDAKEKPETSTRRTDSAFIFNIGEQSSSSLDERSVESPTNKTEMAQQQEEDRSPAEQAIAEQRFSFNIFDGTNATGMFADFIHEGDSDDEQMDREETLRWASIQGRV